MSNIPPGFYRKTRGIIRSGLRADQPLATEVLEGTLYFVEDESLIERSDGTAWQSYSPVSAGDVNGPLSSTDNAVVLFNGTTGKIIKDSAETISAIIADAVAAAVAAIIPVNLASEVTGDLPFANIVQIATARLLGRNTGGTGDIEALATIPQSIQDAITRTGTVTSGTWSSSFGVVSGANLTNLAAANLTGSSLPAGITASSLTSLGTLISLINSGILRLTGISTITNAGTFTGNASGLFLIKWNATSSATMQNLQNGAIGQLIAITNIRTDGNTLILTHGTSAGDIRSPTGSNIVLSQGDSVILMKDTQYWLTLAMAL